MISFSVFVCSFQLISQIIFMALWNIDLNSISAVNLVLVSFFILFQRANIIGFENALHYIVPYSIPFRFQAVAICVESCLPILVAYNFSSGKNVIQRVEEAASTVSPSVCFPSKTGENELSFQSFCGLTVPMTLGTVMLTFAQSPFFNVSFFPLLFLK